MINGIKCFVKYAVRDNQCYITVYSKIHPQPIDYIIEDIDEDTFNPRTAIKKLYLRFGKEQKDSVAPAPIVEQYDLYDDAFVETFADTIFYMVPTNIISYLYCSKEHSIKLVNYEIQTLSNGNTLKVRIVDPVLGNKQAFEKLIEPQFLFKYLKNHDLEFEDEDYEMALNPIRYRHVIISSILK